MILFSVPAIRKALKKYGVIPGVKFAGLYDLRLKVSIDHPCLSSAGATLFRDSAQGDS